VQYRLLKTYPEVSVIGTVKFHFSVTGPLMNILFLTNSLYYCTLPVDF
jgi:hypothetical protein